MSIPGTASESYEAVARAFFDHYGALGDEKKIVHLERVLRNVCDGEREACAMVVNKLILTKCPCEDACERCDIALQAHDAIVERGEV